MKLKTAFVLNLFFLLTLPVCANSGIDIQCTPSEVTAFQGEKIVFHLTITNHMLESIRPGTNHFISYHLYDEAGKSVAYDNRRYPLPRVLRRNKTTRFNLPVFFSYPQSGTYTVEFDIVKEGEYWGSSKKWQTAKIKLHLKPLFSNEFKKKYLKRFYDTGNDILNRHQYLLRLTLKNAELYFSDFTFFGFAAGSDYPAVWIRDTATLIKYAMHFYPRSMLAKSIELFLEHQGNAGDIVDSIDLKGNTDKNTVETDQESSLVLAAASVAAADPAWLNKKISGQAVIQRLEQALEWVWQHKLNKEYQLITSAFTADWGDLDNSYPDQRATKLNDKSTLVLGIYTQAKYIQAIDAFIALCKTPPAKWNERLEILKRQAITHLYLKDQGYFITHIVPGKDKEKYFKMEKEILPVGGNAEAILAGLMNTSQVKRFLDVLQQRRKKYQLRTISFTLLPPYPEGFFSHHLLKNPWSYQNGGEWDWIGARVILALQENGFQQEAKSFLLEIAKKNLANYCIYEWEDRSGTGRGALYYAGAAGLLGEAIYMVFPKNTLLLDQQ